MERQLAKAAKAQEAEEAEQATVNATLGSVRAGNAYAGNEHDIEKDAQLKLLLAQGGVAVAPGGTSNGESSE